MGSSKKQTVGYQYWLGTHQILTHGPVDRMLRYTVDDRVAWTGNSTGGSITVNAPSLFGGEGREGGVSGTFDFELGALDQGPNDYLQSKLGTAVPSFRGVVGVVQRQMYLGNNPYLKKNAWTLQRIHVRQDGIEQWYDERAAIGTVTALTPVSQNIGWASRPVDYFVIGASQEISGSYDTPADQSWWKGYIDSVRVTKGVARYKVDTIPLSGSNFPEGAADPYWDNVVTLTKFNNGAASCAKGKTVTLEDGAVISTDEFLNGTSSCYFDGVHSWAKVVVGAGNQDLGDIYTIEGWVYLTERVTNAHGAVMLSCGPLNVGGYDTGYGVLGSLIHHYQYDAVLTNNVNVLGVLGAVPLNRWVHLAFTVDAEAGLEYVHVNGKLATGEVVARDMNPAHIIRECLTDPIWGMGYNEDDMYDPSFMAAADTLFAEGMGMSLLWDRQMPIEQFVQEVVKHINAALYVGRRGDEAGKFVLRLIRADYDEELLPLFDESNVEKFEGYKRVQEGELTNSVTVNYSDADTGKTASTTAQDPALVQQQGAVINTTMQYPGFTNRELADKVALRDLQTLSTPLASGVLYTGTDAKELNIGDVIAVSWEDYGLVRLPMRITGMTLGDGKSNKVKLTVTQDAFALPAQGVVVPPDVSWEDPSQEPLPITRQYAEEMPYYELVQQLGQSVADTQLSTMPNSGMVGAAAARPQTGAINARMLTDAAGDGYEDVAAIDFSPFGLLADDIDRMTEVFDINNTVDAANIQIGSYAKIGNEYVYIVDRDGTTLTVKRAVLDTVPLEHAAGTSIFFSDPFLQFDPTEYVASDIVDVKLLTVAGQGTLSEAFAVAMQVELVGRANRPYPPGNFKINDEYYPNSLGSETELVLTWAHRDRKLQTGGELVGFKDGNVGPEPGVTYTVKAYSINDADVETEFFSQDGITDTTYTIDLDANPPGIDTIFVSVRLFSVRDTIESLYHQRCDLSILTAPYNLTATYSE